MSTQVGKCTICKKLMNGSGCIGYIEIGKKKYQRIPNENSENCHDCGAKPGLLHHWKCDCETCPKCHGQALSCECSDDYTLVASQQVPTYMDEKYVKIYLKKKSDNDLLIQYNLPSNPKEWKDIFVKELIKRGVSPATEFVNPYAKFPSDLLLQNYKKPRLNQNMKYLIRLVLKKRGDI